MGEKIEAFALGYDCLHEKLKGAELGAFFFCSIDDAMNRSISKPF
ncbi:hypothetical protein ACTHQ8_10625 [Lysinibacillus odysseyi]|nr:hypothetical protein [Lysinibacillus odysseyi]